MAIFVPFQVGLILRLQLHVHCPGVYYVFFKWLSWSWNHPKLACKHQKTIGPIGNPQIPFWRFVSVGWWWATKTSLEKKRPHHHFAGGWNFTAVTPKNHWWLVGSDDFPAPKLGSKRSPGSCELWGILGDWPKEIFDASFINVKLQVEPSGLAVWEVKNPSVQSFFLNPFAYKRFMSSG